MLLSLSLSLSLSLFLSLAFSVISLTELYTGPVLIESQTNRKAIGKTWNAEGAVLSLLALEDQTRK